jgi:hypothetical protein
MHEGTPVENPQELHTRAKTRIDKVDEWSEEEAGSARLDGGRRWGCAGVTGRWWRTAIGSDAIGGAGEIIEAVRDKGHENGFGYVAESLKASLSLP